MVKSGGKEATTHNTVTKYMTWDERIYRYDWMVLLKIKHQSITDQINNTHQLITEKKLYNHIIWSLWSMVSIRYTDSNQIRWNQHWWGWCITCRSVGWRFLRWQRCFLNSWWRDIMDHWAWFTRFLHMKYCYTIITIRNNVPMVQHETRGRCWRFQWGFMCWWIRSKIRGVDMRWREVILWRIYYKSRFGNHHLVTIISWWFNSLFIWWGRLIIKWWSVWG